MPSSASSLETPPEVWSGLSRLRDVSRLLLDAIERDDVDGILRLSLEGEKLAAELGELLDPETLSVAPAEARERLSEFTSMNRLILERLAERRDEVQRELEALRGTKNRLKAVKMNDRPESTLVDRLT